MESTPLPASDEWPPAMSAALRERLMTIPADAPISAIVLLASEPATAESHKQRRSTRQKAIQITANTIRPALQAVDEILRSHGGRRYSEKPNALGSIIVESNRAGLLAVASSQHVKAVLEDQSVVPLK